MITYKNREVDIIQEIPISGTDRVVIQYHEPGLGTEIVPKKDIVESKETPKAHKDKK